MKKIILAVLVIIIGIVGYLFMKPSSDDTVQVEIKVGDKIEPFVLNDQFGQPHTFNKDIKKVIYVCKKDTGHTAKEFFASKSDDFLEKRGAIFIADISKMPSPIRDYVAIPDFQKSSYKVWLITYKKPKQTFRIKGYEDYIIIADIDNFIVRDIRFIKTKEQLSKELEH